VPGLNLDELILDREQYRAVRAEVRARMLPLRRSRRVQVGDALALEFENEQTLHYQVQEMIYAENITSEAAAGEEIETYRRLLPTAGSVSATMFLEFADLDTVRTSLDGLSGIQHLIELRLGSSRIAGVDVPPPDEADDRQTYSVHFVRFDLAPAQRADLANLTVPAQLSVEHPAYRAATELPAELRAQLVADLA